MRALWVLAVVGVANAVALAWTYWPGALFSGETPAVWLALAWDAAHGELYRPVMDAHGYGGTRYMPLFFMLCGGCMRLAGDPIVGAVVAMQLTVMLLIAGLCGVLRAQGLRWGWAVPLAMAVVFTVGGQQDVVELRGDVLAAALVTLSVLGLLRWSEGGRPAWLAAAGAFAVAAVFTKVTAVYGACVGVMYLWRRGERRAAVALGSGVLLACAGGVVALQWVTDGRFGEAFVVAAMLGADPGGALGRLGYNAVVGDPLGTVLILAGFVAWTRCPPGSPARLMLPVVLAVTVLIHATDGIWINHLLDMHVASIIALGAAAATDAPGRRVAALAGATLAAGIVLTWIPGVPSVRADATEGRRTRAAVLDIHRRFLTPPVPYLATNAQVAIAADDRPFLLDAFNLRRFLDAGQPAGLDFERRVRARWFRVIVDDAGADVFPGDVDHPSERLQSTWWTRPNERTRFYAALRPYYHVASVRGPFVVLVPRGDGLTVR